MGIRPDSEYTVGILAGTIKARENVALATEARRLFLRLLADREQVWIARVPAHQDDQPWNQRADALATRGLASGASKPDERWEGWRPIEGCDNCIGMNESCPVCKTTFADSPNTPSGAPVWMPSPAMSSRAASGLWNSCEHEPCRACVPDVSWGEAEFPEILLDIWGPKRNKKFPGYLGRNRRLRTPNSLILFFFYIFCKFVNRNLNMNLRARGSDPAGRL